MSETYFRIQSADRDVTDLLDPGYQFSRTWNAGGRTVEGISTCASLDDLAMYLAQGESGAIRAALDARPDQWVIVEVEADPIDGAAPVDPVFEILVRPTRIVAVTPCGDDFMAAIAEADALMDSYDTHDWDD